MASALARGWGDPVLCSDVVPNKAETLAAEVGGRAVSNAEIGRSADVVILCHKPDQVATVAADLAPVIAEPDYRTTEGRVTVVSILAGVPLSAVRAAYPDADAVRLMPNVAVEIGRGVICLADESTASDDVVALLERVATVVRVPERLIDVATAVMGVGPAYVSLFVEAQVDAAVRLGMPPALAVELATATTEGSAALLAARGYDTLALRRAVTSPGGVTARGLAALEESGLRAAFQAAADAAVHGGRR